MRRLKSLSTYIKPSKIHGFGVFAGQHFVKGDIIEQAPVIRLLDKAVTAMLESGSNYLCNYTQKIDNQHIIPLGNGAVYNHCNKPNASLTYDNEHHTFEIIALAPIRKGEEILIYYGKTWVENTTCAIASPKETKNLIHALFKLPIVKTGMLLFFIICAIKFI